MANRRPAPVDQDAQAIRRANLLKDMLMMYFYRETQPEEQKKDLVTLENLAEGDISSGNAEGNATDIQITTLLAQAVEEIGHPWKKNGRHT